MLSKFLILLMFCCSILLGKSPAPLESEKLTQLYFDGDFDKLADLLNQTLRQTKPPIHRDDSLQCLRYLGVIYGSYPEERIKGESYLTLLFQKSPDEPMKDLLLSDELEVWVEGVRGKVVSEMPRQPAGLAEKTFEKELKRKEKVKLVSYAAGGGAVLAIAGYLFWQNYSRDESVTYATSF